MNIDPNLLDFERGGVYTRKRQEMNSQTVQQNQRNMPFPTAYESIDSSTSWNHPTQQNNRQESRNDLQTRFSNYQPIPSTMAFPIYQQDKHPMFFNNTPLNTRLHDYKNDI